MIDLAIIGGGFWGVASALVAEARGARVVLVDDGGAEGASRAASGYFARGWFKGELRARAETAERVGGELGLRLAWTGADVLTLAALKAGSRAFVERRDWATFEPRAFLDLRAVDLRARVDRIVVERARPVRVQLDTGDEIEARAAVVAAGAATDRILAASGLPIFGVSGLGGRGLIFSAAPPPPRTILRQVTPYHAHTIRPWGPRAVRVGETVETVPHKAPEYMTKLLRDTGMFLPHMALATEELWGLRPVLASGPTVREVVPGVIGATGGGRIGGLLAFWAATEVARIAGLS